MRTTLRVLLVFLIYLFAWHASSLFEVRPYVSALYLGCGVTFAVGLILGWRYLPAVYLATVFSTVTSFPELNVFEQWVAPMRQTLIYGLAGLSLRNLWVADTFRLSMPVAARFLVTAFVASLISAFTALQMPPFNGMSADEKQAVFFSFWGGDFAGSMVIVPILLQLHHFVFRRTSGSRLNEALLQWLQGHLRIDLVWWGLAGVGVSILVVAVPHWLGSNVRMDMLSLLPVLVAGLWRGAYVGFIVAMLVSLVEIFVKPHLGLDTGMTIDLQILIAMNAAVALLAGAAHDDKQHEWEHANFDVLTGLANHRHFIDRLQHEMDRSERTGQRFGLIYLDLDGFKGVNDTLGHQAGDELLRQMAHRLKDNVRKTDVVARLGGDEFAILLPEMTDLDKTQRLAQSLLTRVQETAVLKAGRANVSASMGIAFFPTDGQTAMSLMQSADRAMYAAKAKGKNQYAVSPTPQTAAASGL